MAKKKDAVGFQIISLDGKPVTDTIPNDVAEQRDKSGQFVLEIHNETFRLPEDWARFRDWADAWRRVAERNPRYRPEDDTVDHYLRAAMEFCLGKLHWPPDAFWRMTLQEYAAALAGYYDDRPAAERGRTTEAEIRQAFAKVPGWKTMKAQRLQLAVEKVLGHSVGRSTFFRSRKKALSTR